jgi:Xaa-Pro aminopeptidase
MSASWTDWDGQTYARRRQRLLKRVQQHGGPATCLITDATDIRYLSGGVEGAAGLLLGEAGEVVFTNGMLADQVRRECPGMEICICQASMFREALARLRQRGLRELGIQEHALTLAQYRVLRKRAGPRKLMDLGHAARDLRAVKDPGEIARIRAAVEIAEAAVRELLEGGAKVFIGRSEKQLAAELEYRMRRLGADRQAFPGGIIVGSGPGSADCHHRPDERTVQAGDTVLFDWGAEVDGYRSDMTRVVFVGKPTETWQRLYAVVLEAHDAAVAAMRPRVRCHTIDRIARERIERDGYGKEFRHGLGHGIGLAVHEAPGLSRKPANGSSPALRTGMVITVEPGIYLEGFGGVRIEDDILITPDGHERLSALPRDLDAMTLA